MRKKLPVVIVVGSALLGVLALEGCGKNGLRGGMINPNSPAAGAQAGLSQQNRHTAAPAGVPVTARNAKTAVPAAPGTTPSPGPVTVKCANPIPLEAPGLKRLRDEPDFKFIDGNAGSYVLKQIQLYVSEDASNSSFSGRTLLSRLPDGSVVDKPDLTCKGMYVNYGTKDGKTNTLLELTADARLPDTIRRKDGFVQTMRDLVLTSKESDVVASSRTAAEGKVPDDLAVISNGDLDHEQLENGIEVSSRSYRVSPTVLELRVDFEEAKDENGNRLHHFVAAQYEVDGDPAPAASASPAPSDEPAAAASSEPAPVAPPSDSPAPAAPVAPPSSEPAPVAPPSDSPAPVVQQ
jgi:hypothetical protein